MWAIAIVCEYSVPVTAGRAAYRTAPIDLRHVPERLGLFTLIVLGETIVVVALGISLAEWRFDVAAVAFAGFVCAAAIWWNYFGTGEKRDIKPLPYTVFAFTHLHIPMLAALTACSAGVSLAIEGVSLEGSEAGARWALAGGAALFLLCITGIQRFTVQGLRPVALWTQIAAAAALVTLAITGGSLARTAFVVLTAAALAAVAAIKTRLLFSQSRTPRE